MMIWEKDGWVFVQMKDLVTNDMMIDFSVGKKYWEELKEHMIKHLNEFKLADSGEKEKIVRGSTPRMETIKEASIDSKPEYIKLKCNKCGSEASIPKNTMAIDPCMCGGYFKMINSKPESKKGGAGSHIGRDIYGDNF